MESSELVHPGVTSVRAGRASRTDPFAGRSSGVCWPSIFDARRRPQLAIAWVISAKTARSTSQAPTASSDQNLSERTPFDRSSCCGWSNVAPMRALVAFLKSLSE